MKALIYKDLLAIWKYCRNFILMCAVFLAASVFVEEYGFMQTYPVVFMGMLVNTLIAYDERDKWDRQVLTMPITRRQYVTSKYLVGLMLQGLVLVLTGVACALRLVRGGGFQLESFWMEMDVLLVLACLAPSLILPFIFKNGSEKGRMAYIIIIGCLLGLAVALSHILNRLNLMQTQMDLPGGPLLLVLTAAIYVGSWALSVRWYEKREF